MVITSPKDDKRKTKTGKEINIVYKWRGTINTGLCTVQGMLQNTHKTHEYDSFIQFSGETTVFTHHVPGGVTENLLAQARPSTHKKLLDWGPGP